MIALILALACLALVLTFEASEFARRGESAIPARVVIRHDPTRGAPFVAVEPEGRGYALLADGAPVAHLSERGLQRAEFVILSADR